MTDLVPYPEGGKEAEEGPSAAAARRLKALVLDSVSSDHSRRAYSKALDDLLAFLGGRPFTRSEPGKAQEPEAEPEPRRLESPLWLVKSEKSEEEG
jgi:hypothetical protein